MTSTPFLDIERSIARCRLILSFVALVAVFLDPTQPLLSRWLPLTSGTFQIDPYTLLVMGGHLAYSLVAMAVLARRAMPLTRLAAATTWADVLFGAAIATFTEGVTSPFYAFFAFAVVVTGMRAGFRNTLLVTVVSVVLYLSLIVVSTAGNTNIYIMRPVYLAMTGYLVGYLGQQRLFLEAGIRELAETTQRQRIARDLHDGRAQALAGIALRLESCQELLRRGRHTEALLDLSELQSSVNREYDELRTYMRGLVGTDATPAARLPHSVTRFSFRAELDGSADLIEQVLQIVREGIANVRRHARARRATIDVRSTGDGVDIAIRDDGVGFRDPTQQPWSIASRVTELGGQLCIDPHGGGGAHLAISLPRA